VSNAKPTAPTASPTAITYPGGTRRTNAGASIDPTMKAPNDGRVHRPARNGESPATSWRYWKMKRKAPNRTRIPSV
jgi:hypothetical protein